MKLLLLAVAFFILAAPMRAAELDVTWAEARSAKDLPVVLDDLDAQLRDPGSPLRFLLAGSRRKSIQLVLRSDACAGDHTRGSTIYVGALPSTCGKNDLTDFRGELHHELTHALVEERVFRGTLDHQTVWAPWIVRGAELLIGPNHSDYDVLGHTHPMTALQEGLAESVAASFTDEVTSDRDAFWISKLHEQLVSGRRCIEPSDADSSEWYLASIFYIYIEGRRERVAKLIDAMDPDSALSYEKFKRAFAAKNGAEAVLLERAERAHDGLLCR
jgi:hypothetical protein